MAKPIQADEATIPNIAQGATAAPTYQSPDARGQTYLSTAPALAQIGSEASNVADQQMAADQQVWLTQAKSSAELQAQKIAADAQRNAQPGQPILPVVQDAWQKNMQNETDAVASPLLKAKYSDAMTEIGKNLNSTAQSFDYQQQDAYAVHNVNQTVDNKASLYNTMQDPDAITTKAQSDLGEITSNINGLQLAPDKKMELIDSTRKGLISSALDAQSAINPTMFLNQNAPARSPTAVQNDPNTPRGVRNNNPGNLEGNQGFQGFTGTDAGGYAQFSDPDSGLRAMAINLRNQQDIHGLDTVQDIVSKYAPASDNNPTSAYVASVAKALDVDPDTKIDLHDPTVLATLQTAMIKQENGVVPYSGKQIMHAAQLAVDPDNAGPAPGPTNADGSIRTGNPLMSLLKPEEQQAVINHAESVFRQQQMFGRYNDAEASATISQMQENHKLGLPANPDDVDQAQSIVAQSKNPAVQAKWAKFQVDDSAITDFGKMTPLDIANTLAATPLTDKSSPDQVERYAVGQQMMKQMQGQAKADPLSLSARITGTPVPPITQADAQSFQARSQYANTAQQTLGSDYKAFTPEEAPRMAESFSQSAPNQQRAFLTNFAQGFGPRTADAANQIWGKTAPEISYAADMLAQPNITDDQAHTAMQIVAGSQRMKEDKEAVLKANAVDTYLQANGYDKALSPLAYDRVVSAGRALYAGRFSSGAQPDNDDLQKIAGDVMGGELATVHDLPVISPAGVSGDAFERGIQNLDQKGILNAMQKAQTTLGGQPVQLQMPQNKDGAFNPKEDPVRLKTLSNGIYQLIDKNGIPYPAPRMPGGTAILKFDPSDFNNLMPTSEMSPDYGSAAAMIGG